MAAIAARKPIVIVGGGIVGISTAFYVSKCAPEKPIVVVEMEALAASASGRAGGFLAEGWDDQLLSHGFKLHKELAEELKLESFRFLPTFQVTPISNSKSSSSSSSAASKPGEKILLNKGTTKKRSMDPNTAQVTPMELCTKMWETASKTGNVSMVKAKVTNLERETDGMFSVVLDDGKSLQAEKVVLCMGAWQSVVEDWLEGKVPGYKIKSPMIGIASSSAIVKPNESMEIEGKAYFCGEDQFGCHLEMYPRPNNTLYLCGFGGSPELGKDVISTMSPSEISTKYFNEEKFSASVKKSLLHMTSPNLFSDNDSNFEKQCCLRPAAPDYNAVLGAIPNTNIIACSGLNCWGITKGPACGEAIKDIILGNKPKVSLTSYDPLRFSTSTKAT